MLLHLEAFVGVAEERSFSGAADVLGIAQPLLSRRIQTLERSLGGELFDRSRRQIEITGFGDLLLPHARDLLSRAEHFRGVARSATESAVRVLGVPPDCDPPALAGVLRAAADRGVALSVRELPARARSDALADGSLTLALVRVPPGTGSLDVPLGLAGVTPPHGHAIHLESLRPRRGAGATTGTEPALLVTPEDDLPRFVDHLRLELARAGLPEERVQVASSTSVALAETFAGAALLVCTEQFAVRNGISWSPPADVVLRRSYDLVPDAPDWLLPLLGAAIGSVAAPRPDDGEARVRLAVHS
nr:LysR family transcriptional regulator [Actinopolymorpha cephalotaxi]